MRIKVERYLNYKNELHVNLTGFGAYPVSLTAIDAEILRDKLTEALAGPCLDCASETHMTGSGACPAAHYDECDD